MLLLGVIFIVLACVLGGFCLSGEMAAREQNLRHFKNFIIFLQNEVTYRITPVLVAVKSFCKEKDGAEQNPIVKVLQECNDNKDIDFSEVFVNKQEQLSFNDGDLRVIEDFFEQLGETDLNGQKNLFEVTLTRVEECINDAKSVYEQKGKMYKLIGLGVGIVIALLFI